MAEILSVRIAGARAMMGLTDVLRARLPPMR